VTTVSSGLTHRPTASSRPKQYGLLDVRTAILVAAHPWWQTEVLTITEQAY